MLTQGEKLDRDIWRDQLAFSCDVAMVVHILNPHYNYNIYYEEMMKMLYNIISISYN